MSILVTGGAGFIGSHMLLKLLDRNEDVVVIDNLSTGFRRAIPGGVCFLEGNVGDKAFIEEAMKEFSVKTIIHFAGSTVVPESISNPMAYYLNNTANSRTLIDAAIRCNIDNFIFSSTAAVYGIPKESLVDEEIPPSPISPYGRSKLMTEMMLKDAAAAHPLRFIALRYFNVAGADPKGRRGQSTPKATHLIKVACQVALGQRDSIEVFGADYPTPDGTCIRDYIHVSDLVDAHALALDYLRDGGDSLIANCGYGQGYSVREVLEEVKKVSGVDFKVRFGGRRSGDPVALIAKAGIARARFGWTPKHANLHEIISHTFSWEKRLANGQGYE